MTAENGGVPDEARFTRNLYGLSDSIADEAHDLARKRNMLFAAGVGTEALLGIVKIVWWKNMPPELLFVDGAGFGLASFFTEVGRRIELHTSRNIREGARDAAQMDLRGYENKILEVQADLPPDHPENLGPVN